jgi:PTS system mannose-specific IID component
MMAKAVKNRLNFFILFRIYLRNFFIQSGWNFEKMQNLGFIYCMMPALKRIYGNKKDKLKSAVKRHLSFFNTHPYLSAPILGAVIRLEEEYENTGTGLENINSFKNGLMGIFGGVGDSFFWGAARPFAAIIGVIFALISHNFYGPLACFLVYNLIHLTFRTPTFFLGYYEGISITNTLKKIDLRTQTERLKKIQAVLVGFLLALIKNKFVNHEANMVSYKLLLFLALILSVFILYFLMKKKLNTVLIIYITTAIVLLTSYITKGVVWN